MFRSGESRHPCFVYRDLGKKAVSFSPFSILALGFVIYSLYYNRVDYFWLSDDSAGKLFLYLFCLELFMRKGVEFFLNVFSISVMIIM